MTEWNNLWDEITSEMMHIKEAVANLPGCYNLLDFLRTRRLISVEEYSQMIEKLPGETIEWYLVKILRETNDWSRYDDFIRALNSTAGTALLRQCFPSGKTNQSKLINLLLVF